MEYGNISNNSIYGTYKGSYDYQSKQYHFEAAIKEELHKNGKDSLTISDEARQAMHEAKTQMLDISDVKNLTGISKSGYVLVRNRWQ